MADRQIINKTQGFLTKDGAGVKLVRVLGDRTVDMYDPILMLDSFDSTNPADYLAGFPEHPHRGIETISYVYKGKMTHEDSLGNKDTITDGEVQWMTAGSGILHAEMLPASERLLGVQLWLNLPARNKMADPNYHAIKKADIEEIAFEGGMLRLLAGSFQGHLGYQPHYLPLDYYDIHLKSGSSLTLEPAPDRSVMVFTLLGDATVQGELIKEKTAVKLSQGNQIHLAATNGDAQILFMSSTRLDEPVAWGGPIVMNTEEELQQAMFELRDGTFIKQAVEY